MILDIICLAAGIVTGLMLIYLYECWSLRRMSRPRKKKGVEVNITCADPRAGGFVDCMAKAVPILKDHAKGGIVKDQCRKCAVRIEPDMLGITWRELEKVCTHAALAINGDACCYEENGEPVRCCRLMCPVWKELTKSHQRMIEERKHERVT